MISATICYYLFIILTLPIISVLSPAKLLTHVIMTLLNGSPYATSRLFERALLELFIDDSEKMDFDSRQRSFFEWISNQNELQDKVSVDELSQVKTEHRRELVGF